GVVAFGILQSVLFIIGIEMRAGRLEIGWIALRILVDVDGMFSRWQIVQVEPDHHALFALIHNRRTYALALRVLQFDRNFGSAGERYSDNRKSERSAKR